MGISQKRVLGHLKLEFQAAVSLGMDTGNKLKSSARTVSTLNCSDIALSLYSLLESSKREGTKLLDTGKENAEWSHHVEITG